MGIYMYFSQMFVLYFCQGLSRCPYYQCVRNSEVSARQELIAYVKLEYCISLRFLQYQCWGLSSAIKELKELFPLRKGSRDLGNGFCPNNEVQNVFSFFSFLKHIEVSLFLLQTPT